MAVDLESILFRLHARVGRALAALLDRNTRRVVEITLCLLTGAAILSFLHLHYSFVAPYGPPQCFKQALVAAINDDGARSPKPHIFRLRILPRGVNTEALDKLRQALAKRMQRGAEGASHMIDDRFAVAGGSHPLPFESSAAADELSKYLHKYIRIRNEEEASKTSSRARSKAERPKHFEYPVEHTVSASVHSETIERFACGTTNEACPVTGDGSNVSMTWRVEAEVAALLRRLSDDVTAMYNGGDHIYSEASDPHQPIVHALRRWMVAGLSSQDKGDASEPKSGLLTTHRPFSPVIKAS